MGKNLLSSALIVLLVAASTFQQYDQNSIAQALADQVNSLQNLWVAGVYARFNLNNVLSLLRQMGAVEDPNPTSSVPAYNTNNSPIGGLFGSRLLQSYPSSLDLRSRYSACASINYVREQGQCGSCWAFSSMNSLSDRYCIANYNNGKPSQKSFSAQDALECCSACAVNSGRPCDGGYFTKAFANAQKNGASSGEAYNNFNLCKPYFLAANATTYSEPSCQSACAKPSVYKTLLKNDRRTISGFDTGSGEQAMIAALNNGGSLVVTFTVYKDFYLYKSGIYAHTSGDQVGLHAVRVIGYGSDAGTNYWLVANTWGSGWGEKGFFRIRRGADECGFESSTFGYGVI